MNRPTKQRRFWLIQSRPSGLGVKLSGRSTLARRYSLTFDFCEARQLLTLPATLTIPLIPELDQFGDQILVVQGYGIPERSALGIFDTGASAVTFAAQDQDVFNSIEAGPIPIKVTGGAAAGGIGGDITGDVSEPGTIYSDGMHAFNLTFDEFGFPLFDISLSTSAIETPGIQAFVGTDSSPLLPTITGTPAMNPSPKYINGAAAYVNMQGALIDFSDIFPGLVIPFPDLSFTDPGTTLTYDTTNPDIYEPVTLPLVPFGGDNHTDPGELITESLLWLVPGITSQTDTATSTPGSFLFDTGAQLSVISTDMALSLGLDLDNPVTSIDVQGVAGTETIPGFNLTSLNMPRSDGGILQFTDVPIYVLDVAPGIDGIFGMNLLNVASEFVFDPLHPDGAQLSISYFANPDRGTGLDLGGELAALLGGSLGILSGSLGGATIPSFSTPAVSSPIQTFTEITVPTTPVEYGASFSISTQVIGPADISAPTGQITLTDGTTTAFATLDLNNLATATWNSGSSSWAVGSHTIVASYDGDAQFAASTSQAAQVEIVRAGTELTLSTNLAETTIGNPVQISGKLTSSTGVKTSGDSVRILIDGQPAGTAVVNDDGSFSTQFLPDILGSHSIRVVFDGTEVLQSSTSNIVDVNVTPASSQLVLEAPSAVVFGQRIAITATVDPALASAYAGAIVSFYDGNRLLGRSAMNNATATFSVNANQVGRTYQFRAVISPTATGLGSSTSTITTKVGRAESGFFWNVINRPRNQFEWRIVVQAVNPSSGLPSGMIRVTLGGARPRTMNLRLRNGQAVYRYRGSANAPVRLVYTGDRNFNSSTISPA